MNFACAGGMIFAFCNDNKSWSNGLALFISGGLILHGIFT